MKLLHLLRQRANRHAIYSRAAYWNSKAEHSPGDQASMWNNSHLNHLYNRETFAVIDSVCGELEGTDCLELGCGTGRICRFLAARGARVTGVDFAEKALEIARRDPGSGKITYRQISMLELDYREEFDWVISWGSIVFACPASRDPEVLLEKIFLSLRPGGRALLLEPVHSGFLHRVLKMNARAFAASMKNAGFVIDRIEPMHFWPVRLLLAYLRWPAAFTAFFYELGQAFMKRFPFAWMGDYKVIVATKPK